MLPGNGEGMNFQEMIIHQILPSCKFNFQEHINLVNYWTSSWIHIYWLTFGDFFIGELNCRTCKKIVSAIHLVFTD